MEKKYEDPVFSRNVLEMITVANEYCLFIEKVENYSREDLLSYLCKICPLLYIKGTLLPDVERNELQASERFVTEEQYEVVFNDLRKAFHPDDEYWFMNNSDPLANEPIKASLAENFSDVYQDLKDFILLYQKNMYEAQKSSIRLCKEWFKSRWGFRLVNAHKVIHHMQFDKEDNLYQDIFE